MNSFGDRLRLTTFGESHGAAIGGILDGLPAGVKIDEAFLRSQMAKRKPGGKYATSRKEDDEVELLSGIFDGISTGAPIGFIIKNKEQKSGDYDNLKDIFRPGHADFTYFAKWGIREHRGGGRASARETAIRVAAGAIAQMMLNEFDISVQSGVYAVGELSGDGDGDFDFAQNSEIFALYPDMEERFKEQILTAKNAGDSVGASVLTVINGVKAGLGEPLYNRLDAKIAEAMMGINGVKAVEIGEGVNAARLMGSQNNDFMQNSANSVATTDSQIHHSASGDADFKNIFMTNHSGGILGGISTGQEIIIKTHFKPTPSIFLAQNTIDKTAQNAICALRGRHDPCIGIRGSVVATAMARLVVADMLLLNAASKMEHLRRIYG